MSNYKIMTGDLPPVGTRWEITHNGHKGLWRGVEILKYEYDPGDEGYPRAAVKHLYGGDESFTAGCLYWVFGLNDDDFEFRPIQSDREKAIEKMLDIAGWHKSKEGVRFFEKLYDAGYRRPDHDLKSQLIATEVSLENAEVWKDALVEVVNDLLEKLKGQSILQLHGAEMRAKELLDSMEQKK